MEDRDPLELAIAGEILPEVNGGRWASLIELSLITALDPALYASFPIMARGSVTLANGPARRPVKVVRFESDKYYIETEIPSGPEDLGAALP